MMRTVKIMAALAVLALVGGGYACKNFQTGAARGGIHKAAKDGDLEKLKSLLDENAELINDRDPMLGYTPLHRAASQGNYEIVQYLLENGADVNPKSKKGETPLKLAVQQDRTDVADLLRYYGGEE